MPLVTESESINTSFISRLRSRLWIARILIISGVILILIGGIQLIIKLVSSQDHTYDPADSALQSRHSENPPPVYLEPNDLRYLMMWDRLQLHKILPPSNITTVHGVIYWESLITYRFPFLSSQPEVISIIPVLTSGLPLKHGWESLDKFQDGDHLYIRDHPYLEQLQCTYEKLWGTYDIRQLTIVKTSFNLEDNIFKHTLSLNLDSSHSLPPDYFRKSWAIMPSQDRWCYDYHIFFDSKITQKQQNHLQLSPTPEDPPVDLDIKDPISECSSHLGKRAIYWSQRDLPRKVAQYITHSPFAIGEFRDGIYKITSIIDSNIPISLVVPLVRQHGMFQVQDEHKNETLWVEPITGNLYKDPHWTHYSMVASWLPMCNGTGIDPLTGKVVSSDTANTPISLIEKTEEFYPTSLYTKGSLSGIIEDNII
ncbi:unnamed protein product [Parnassius apollo]|uniref:(apollo) hypothetical protein n=1 Tax=Parnassius apollo TaxID=110799 RepID=A0A8S3X6M9_PARAO|nr:unnamed protein product [Parnassius apollo]